MIKNENNIKEEKNNTQVQHLSHLLDEVSQGLASNFNADYVWIGLIDGATGKMVKAHSFGKSPGKRTTLAKLQNNVCKGVFKSGKSDKLEIAAQGVMSLRSILFMPIKLEKIEKHREPSSLTLGVVQLGSTRSRHFSREDETKISTIVNIVAYAIWNYTYGPSETFSKRLGYRITRVNLHETISEGLEKLIKFLGADHGTLYRFDKETHNFFDVVAKGVSEKFWEHAVPRKDGVAAHVIKYTEPKFLEDISKVPLFNDSPYTKGEKVKSTAAASLAEEGILFLSYSQKHRFSELEKQQFTLFSKIIAAVFRSLRIAEELKWGQEGGVAETPDWSAMIKLFFEKQLLKMAGINVIRLYIYDRSTERHSLTVQAGAISPETPKKTKKKAKRGGVVEQFARGKKPDFFPKIEESPLRDSSITKKENIKSAAVFPLLYGQSEALGVLFINYRSQHEFSEEEKGRLIGLAGFLTLVLNSVSKDIELTRTINIMQSLHGDKDDVISEDIHSTLQIITDGVAYLTKADLVISLMHRKQKREFLLGGVYGIDENAINKKFPLKQGIGREVLDSGKEKTISNLEDVYPHSVLYKKAGIRSVQCVPLIYANEIIGLLYWGYRSKKFPQPDYSLELLKIFYGEASQRISNYLSGQRINQKQKQLESLLDITKIVHASKLDLRKTLKEMTKIITDKLGYARGIVSLKKKIGEQYFFDRVALVGLNKDEIKNLKQKSSWNTEEQIKKVIALRKEFQISNSYYIPSRYSSEVKRILSSVNVLEPEQGDYRESFEWQPEDYLFIPLRKGGEIIGLLSVDEPVDKAVPTVESVRTLEIFAEHLVLAVENARRYDRRLEELKMLKEIDEDIINKIGRRDELGFGLPSVLASIIKKSRIIGKVDYADIFLKDGVKLRREANFTASEHEKYLGEEEFSINQKRSVAARVTRNKRSELIGNLKHKKWKDVYSTTYKDMKAELAVPMMQGKEVIGVINVESAELNAFDREDQRYLESLAAQSVIAIQNVKAYEQKVQQLEEYSILHSIEKKIGSSLDLEEIVNHVLDVVVSNTHSEIGHISLWDKDNKELEILAHHGIRDIKIARYKKGITVLAAQQQKEIYVPDLDEPCPCCEQGTWRENHFYPIKKELIKSELAIPVIYDNNVLGVINLESIRFDAFKDHIPLVTFISRMIGRAMEQAKQHEKELQEEEGRVTRDLLGFLGQTMMHEFHSYLAAIRVNLEILSKLKGEENDKRNKILQRSDKIINDTLYEIERLPEETTLEEFEIQGVLSGIIAECENYREYTQGIQISQHLSDNKIMVEANRRCMYIIIRNLLQNAFAAMPNGGSVSIEVKKSLKRVEIIVRDTGEGISEENQKKLFSTVMKGKKEKGLGIFLMISRSLMLSFKGNIELVESKKGEGTTFKLWLPLAAEA